MPRRTENKPSAHMSQKSHPEPPGNTKTGGGDWQYYRYSFTLPREEIEKSQLSQHLKGFCKNFTFQCEQSESGYVHWQCEVSLKTKLRKHEFKNLLGFNKAHIEPTINYFASKNYCGKAETKLEGPYNENSVFVITPTLDKKWQDQLRSELINNNGYDNKYYRKIIICVDVEGGAGKTDFATWFMDNFPEHTAYFPYGKIADMAYAIPKDPKYIFFDIPRTQQEHINWSAIELLKNGILFSSKYESGFKRFNRPHVIVMLNEYPDMNALSRDRYDIRTLDKNLLQIYEYNSEDEDWEENE